MKKHKIIKIFLSLLLIFISACKKEASNVIKNGGEYTAQEVQKGINFNTAIIIIAIIVVVVAFSFFFFKNVFPVGLWFKSWTAGVRVGIRSFFNMYFQKIPAEPIISNLIVAKKAGVELRVKQLEDFFLAKINIDEIVQAHIQAYNAGVEITIDQLANASLSKINIGKLIQALILSQNAEIETNYEDLKQMSLKGVDIVKIVKSRIESKNSGFPIDFNDLAEHYLAEGDLNKTVNAYIAAKKANLKDFDFEDIANLNLAGYDVNEIINKAITPRVSEGDKVKGIARDGVEISMKVKVTLRAKLKHIIGNPEEKTILARINEGLATEIGLSKTHQYVLQNPYELADRVEQKRLDENTAFEILSIDVSDLAIGKDIIAELKTERAKADGEMAKADLLKADEKLKKAMAAAFMDGKITVQEYENIMNIQADTQMRQSISKQQDDDDETSNNEQNEDNEE